MILMNFGLRNSWLQLVSESDSNTFLQMFCDHFVPFSSQGLLWDFLG